MLIATVQGKPYYKIIKALKSLDFPFDSVSPEEAALFNSQLVITTEQERNLVGEKNMLLDSELDDEPALVHAKILRSITAQHLDDQLIVGIDPGKRIGIAAYYLQKEIESQVLTSVRKSVDLISVLIKGTLSRKKVVRIGYGDPLTARQIANRLYEQFSDSITIEFVNEYGTSTIRGRDVNRRVMRDKLSARAIALRKGKPFRPSLAAQH